MSITQLFFLLKIHYSTTATTATYILYLYHKPTIMLAIKISHFLLSHHTSPCFMPCLNNNIAATTTTTTDIKTEQKIKNIKFLIVSIWFFFSTTSFSTLKNNNNRNNF